MCVACVCVHRYERGVHGLREEVQEKERFKALHEERCDEVKRLV